jgi:hypothetical protein
MDRERAETFLRLLVEAELSRLTEQGDITMHLQVVPPLSHGTTWIEVLLAGQSAEARATLPLRWQ